MPAPFIFFADCRGDRANCIYPHRAELTDKASMIEPFKHDFVCAEYRNNYRSRANFVSSTILVLDCDNDHSDNPSEWVTPEDVAKAFEGVHFIVHYSRNHDREKEGRSARPRFHVLFVIDCTTDSVLYTEMKKRVAEFFPYFDKNAMDAARLIYGTENPLVEVYEGTRTLTAFFESIDRNTSSIEGEKTVMSTITEGFRNATLSHTAGRILKRHGDTDKAYAVFLEHSARCQPPLAAEELSVIWTSARKFFHEVVEKQEGYVSPEEYQKSHSLMPDDFSDIGQARVLAKEYGNELVYTDATDYMRYQGAYWEESKQLAVGACEELTDLQLADVDVETKRCKQELIKAGVPVKAVEAGKIEDKDLNTPKKRKAYAALKRSVSYGNFVMRRRDMKYISSALQAAKPMLLKNIRAFDADEFLLNTPEATYDLRAGMNGAMPHNPADLITKMTAVSPGAKGADIWKKALDEFFQEDQELIEYVQMIAGLAAIGKVYVEALIIAHGTGRNGKSTFFNTISHVLGSYSGSLSADTLTVGCKRNVKPEMAELRGKRLVIASELEEGNRFNTSLVKQLCSTDDIAGEKKYKDPFKYTPTHTLILYTNYLPKVGGQDEGIWRRLIVIPFNAVIEGKKDIKNYSDYLVKEAGPAVLAWIIEGAEKVIEAKFSIKTPEKVLNSIGKYREENDWLGAFINERCEVGESFSAKSGEFYKEYRTYCLGTGEYIRSTTDFYTALENKGFIRRKTNKGIFISGLRLSSEFMTE